MKIKTTENRLLIEETTLGPTSLNSYYSYLKNAIELVNSDFEAYIIIMDYQASNINIGKNKLETNIIELVKDHISVGVNPNKCNVFIQSCIPEISELSSLLSALVYFKQKSESQIIKRGSNETIAENFFHSRIFQHTISQAASALIFNPTAILTGEDQLPLVDLTRDLAKKFNKTFAEIFNIPKPVLGDSPKTISLNNKRNPLYEREDYILLKDSAANIKKKISKVETDSGNEIFYDPVNKPGVSSLIRLYSLINNQNISNVVDGFKNSNYKSLKNALSESLASLLAEFQQKREKVTNSEATEVIKRGNRNASKIAKQNIKEIKKLMGLNYEF